MHLVHWKKSYGSFEKASKKLDGLAVVGYLFKVSKNSLFLNFHVF